MEKVARRTVLKAGAWVAPAVIATSMVPAYAASKIEYKPTASYGASYTYSTTANTLSLGSNIRRTLPYPNGFGVRYETGMGKTLEVTVTALKIVYAFPKGWVTGLKLTSGTYSQPVKVSGSKYGISDASYDTFEAVFAAPAKGMTQPSNVTERQAIPGTAYAITATSFGYVEKRTTIPTYMGFIGSFTTADGFSNSFNMVGLVPMNR